MTGTVIDTLIICTMTGLSIVVTGTWNIALVALGGVVTAETKNYFTKKANW